MGRLFGTDGVRGVANKELMPELAFKLGRAGARVLSMQASRRPVIMIGKDTRLSCDMLEAAMAAGICSAGADAVSLGVVPTPAVACLTAIHGADAGVVISASHNSFEFNGIKFFNGLGYKLPDEIEDRIESLALDPPADSCEPPVGDAVGRMLQLERSCEQYVDWLIGGGRHAVASDDKIGFVEGIEGAAPLNCLQDLRGLTVALDCANGAASQAAPMLFRRLGATVRVSSGKPDGVNINAGCGSTHISKLRAFVKKMRADVGFAFDGDADRVLAVDERGGVIDGDHILAMLALDMKRRGELAGDTVVATIMSNLGLEIMAKENGINLERTAVGDRYVLERLAEGGFTLGGEQSGHIICMDGHTTGDGLFTALKLSRLLVRSGKPFSKLASVMRSLPQVLRNARVSNEKKHLYMEDAVIRARCRELEASFAGSGRALIRPSGTEPLIRVMIESGDADLIVREADSLASLIEARLG